MSLIRKVFSLRRSGYAFKISVFCAWVFLFYLQFDRPYIARLSMNISPALLLSSIPRASFRVLWISLPFIILAIMKGRYFCRRLCPVGALQDFLPSSSFSFSFGNSPYRGYNKYIFISLLVISLFSINLIAFFDPMVTFNRAITATKMSAVSAVIFAAPILIILLFSVYKRRFWCANLCPLGAIIDWIIVFKVKGIKDTSKRNTLAALGIGLTAGLIKTRISYPREIDTLLRPPGALEEGAFLETCLRCGSCIAICPTKTLTPSLLENGITGIFTPKLVPRLAKCDENCNKCGQVCPTQAIKNLTLAEKRNFKIGTAEIGRTECRSWQNKELCLICRNHCPYHAIGVVKNEQGNLSPYIISDLCRGCGACENVCPTRPSRAVKVYSHGKTILEKNHSPV